MTLAVSTPNHHCIEFDIGIHLCFLLAAVYCCTFCCTSCRNAASSKVPSVSKYAVTLFLSSSTVLKL